MTTLQFLGLFVVLYTDGIGYQMLMPDFPNLQPRHTAVIAYLDGTRDDTGSPSAWPQERGSVNIYGVEYKYVKVKKENIAITGSTDAPPLNLKEKIPHLTCCCPQFVEGFKEDFSNPNMVGPLKRSAHVYVNNGTATVQTDVNGAMYTQVKMSTVGNGGVTVRGTTADGGNVLTIVFKPGATVIFANSSFETTPPLPQKVHKLAEQDHFQAYYDMGKATSGCNAVPSQGGTCAGTITACPVTKAKPTSGTKRASHAHEIEKALSGRKSDGTLFVSIDCSNSQYP
ncbi:MAG: hypothetical protein AABO58_19370 [Acidobacteriota bacterium]